MKKTIIPLTATTLALAFSFLSCGGGGGGNKPPAPVVYATRLDYTNPSNAGYRFVKAESSTATKLVLELRGPASDTGRGVSFSVASDASKAAFAKVDQNDPEYAQNVAFDLGSTDPKLFKGLLDGASLKVSVAQKGATATAKPLGDALVRIALEMKPNIAQNTNITLTASDARTLPASGGSLPITIAVGKLVAK